MDETNVVPIVPEDKNEEEIEEIEYAISVTTNEKELELLKKKLEICKQKKKVMEKYAKMNVKQIKEFASRIGVKEEKKPKLEALQKKATDNNISIFNNKGGLLTQVELYNKLKVFNLDDKKEEEVKRKFVKKTKPLEELEAERDKMLEKKKATAKDKRELAVILLMIEQINEKAEEKQSDDEKLDAYEMYKLEEIKILDAMLFLNSSDKTEIYLQRLENCVESLEQFKVGEKLPNILKLLFESDKITPEKLDKYIKISEAIQSFFKLFQKVKKSCFKTLIRQYINSSPLTRYSRLLFYEIIRKKSNEDCLVELDLEQEYKLEIEKYHELENSFMTSDQLKKNERYTKIELSQKQISEKDLKSVKQKIKDVETKLDILQDDDDGEKEKLFDTLKILKEQEKDLEVWILKFEMDLKTTFAKNIKDLKEKLAKIPKSLEEQEKLKDYQMQIDVLNLNPFTNFADTNFTLSKETYGEYVFKDPFTNSKLDLKDIKSYRAQNIDKIREFLNQEILILKELCVCEDVKKVKMDYIKRFSSENIKNIRYLVSLDKTFDKEVKELIELQKRVDERNNQKIKKLEQKIKEIEDDPSIEKEGEDRRPGS